MVLEKSSTSAISLGFHSFKIMWNPITDHGAWSSTLLLSADDSNSNKKVFTPILEDLTRWDRFHAVEIIEVMGFLSFKVGVWDNFCIKHMLLKMFRARRVWLQLQGWTCNTELVCLGDEFHYVFSVFYWLHGFFLLIGLGNLGGEAERWVVWRAVVWPEG